MADLHVWAGTKAGRMRPHLTLLILCFFCANLFAAAGCGLLPGNQANNKITLTLWYKKNSIDDKLLAEVNKTFPNIILQAQKIGKGFDNKLRIALAGQSDVPDLVGLNANIATYFPDADQFVDLNKLGAQAVHKQYLDWKWKQAITPTGKLIAFPMDTGPTALFYRTDIFQQAGLASSPEDVSTHIATWDNYLYMAQRVQAATNGKSYLIGAIGSVFNQVMGQMDRRYFDQTGNYIGEQDHVRRAWDLAIKVHQLHLSAKTTVGTTDWTAAVSNGTLAAFVGAVWMKNYLKDAAHNSIGKWRVARAPGGDGNDGGSFLAITKYSAHPKEAYQLVQWLLSPERQLQAYQDVNLFPSAPSIYTSPKMAQAEVLFGGQNTTEVFSQAAKNVHPSYFGPDYDAVNGVFQRELLTVDTQDIDPMRAWQDAQQQIERDLSH